MKLRDKFWLWGHPEGAYNNGYGNSSPSRMTPMEACLYLGVRNTFMTPMEIPVDRRQYNKSFVTLRNVAWDIGRDLLNRIGDPAVVEEYLANIKDFPNITASVFDDFKVKDKYKNVPVQALEKIMDRLHNNNVRHIDSWMVLYTHEFGVDEKSDTEFLPYMDTFDGIIMWTWEEKDVVLIPEKYEIFKKQTPNNKRMFGCYLWNFGEKKPATREAVLWQLDFYREKIMLGEAEGVVLHTNTMADLDLDAYDAAVEWMKLHGDEEID